MFPRNRMRRLRRSEGLRRLAAETALSADDFILPVFVVPGSDRREPVGAMPGVSRMSVDLLREWAAGLEPPALLVFGVPDADQKDDAASAAVEPDGLVPRAVRAIKDARPDLTVITDVCVCGYMTHGHCGVLGPSGEVDNDRSIELLARMAECHAAAGADMVAPSAMMDGQVAAIREALDEGGFDTTGIVSYAVKYASSLYSPFRDATDSGYAFGDRRSYQMDVRNSDEAVREVELDIREGADIVMIKPALGYLDIVRRVKERFMMPTAVYSVSGEYAMIKAAARAGWLDEDLSLIHI